MRRILGMVAVVWMCVWAAVPASAQDNDITGEIEAALKAYQNGNIAEALDAIRLAEQWLLELQAGDLATVFPDLEGWEKEVGETAAAGQAMFGGGVTATCHYSRPDGNGEYIDVSIVGNSPMLSMVSGLMGMAAASGKKIVRVHGTKSVLELDGENAELMIPYDGTVLITIETNAGKDQAIACGEALGWDTIDAMSAN